MFILLAHVLQMFNLSIDYGKPHHTLRETIPSAHVHLCYVYVVCFLNQTTRGHQQWGVARTSIYIKWTSWSVTYSFACRLFVYRSICILKGFWHRLVRAVFYGIMLLIMRREGVLVCLGWVLFDVYVKSHTFALVEWKVRLNATNMQLHSIVLVLFLGELSYWRFVLDYMSFTMPLVYTFSFTSISVCINVHN